MPFMPVQILIQAVKRGRGDYLSVQNNFSLSTDYADETDFINGEFN